MPNVNAEGDGTDVILMTGAFTHVIMSMLLIDCVISLRSLLRVNLILVLFIFIVEVI